MPSPLNKMFDIILKFVLLFVPIAYTTGMNLSPFNTITFQLSVLALLCASFFSSPVRLNTNMLRVLGAFIILAGLGIFWHNFNPYILNGFSNLCFGCLGIVLIYYFCKDPEVCYKYIIAGGIINILAVSLQSNGIEIFLKNVAEGQPGGILGHAPILGMYLALTAFIALDLSYLAFILWCGVCIAISEIMIIPISILSMFFYPKLRKYGIILFIIGCALLSPSIFESFRIRFILWKPVIEAIFQRPLIGYGIGIFPVISDQILKIANYKPDSALSSLLEAMFSFGLVGFSIVCFYVYKIFPRNLKVTVATKSLFGLGVLSLFEYPFEFSKLWIIVCFIIANFLIYVDKEGSDAKRSIS